MIQVLGVLDNAIIQGLVYGIAVLGVAVAFRVLRYPDLTPDGSFLAGAVVFAALLVHGVSWPLSLAGAVAAGCVAGVATGLLHTKGGVNPLLTGILTTMAVYSISFRILGGRPDVGVLGHDTMFSRARSLDAVGWAAAFDVHPRIIAVSLGFAAVAAFIAYLLLRSELGLVLRATGANSELVENLARRPQRYEVFGLAVANGLVALAGGLTTARQGFVDVNMGFGIIIILIAALVIGEEFARRVRVNPRTRISGRILSSILGGFLYFLFYLAILRASILGVLPFRIEPTDLELLSAAVVAGVIMLRTRSARGPEEAGFDL